MRQYSSSEWKTYIERELYPSTGVVNTFLIIGTLVPIIITAGIHLCFQVRLIGPLGVAYVR